MNMTDDNSKKGFASMDPQKQEEIAKQGDEIEKLKVVDIFSDLKPDDPWKGYRGFVTREVLT